jgi:hypothetical protein
LSRIKRLRRMSKLAIECSSMVDLAAQAHLRFKSPKR